MQASGREAAELRARGRRTVVAHEIAHQWWGHQVGWLRWRDQWLSEAMANYAALLWARKYLPDLDPAIGPIGAWQDDLTATLADGRSLESVGPVVLGGRLDSSLTEEAYEPIVYRKGAVVLEQPLPVLGRAALPRDVRQAGPVGPRPQAVDRRPSSHELGAALGPRPRGLRPPVHLRHRPARGLLPPPGEPHRRRPLADRDRRRARVVVPLPLRPARGRGRKASRSSASGSTRSTSRPWRWWRRCVSSSRSRARRPSSTTKGSRSTAGGRRRSTSSPKSPTRSTLDPGQRVFARFWNLDDDPKRLALLPRLRPPGGRRPGARPGAATGRAADPNRGWGRPTRQTSKTGQGGRGLGNAPSTPRSTSPRSGSGSKEGKLAEAGAALAAARKVVPKTLERALHQRPRLPDRHAPLAPRQRRSRLPQAQAADPRKGRGRRNRSLALPRPRRPAPAATRKNLAPPWPRSAPAASTSAC